MPEHTQLHKRKEEKGEGWESGIVNREWIVKGVEIRSGSRRFEVMFFAYRMKQGRSKGWSIGCLILASSLLQRIAAFRLSFI
jgi:hypothetical protein